MAFLLGAKLCGLGTKFVIVDQLVVLDFDLEEVVLSLEPRESRKPLG